MNLIRWEPFKEADDFFRGLSPALFGRWPRLSRDTGEAKYEWSPAADISETDKEYLVKAELPGIKREDVKVTLADGFLTIEGERKFDQEDASEKTHRVESFRGSFYRSFSLPDNADAANISAETKDGILKVHLPKVKVQKPQAVEIKIQ